MEYILSNAPHKKELKIKSINIENNSLAKRLEELGMIENQTISIFSAPTRYNMLVVVRNVVFALDKNICKQVIVYD